MILPEFHFAVTWPQTPSLLSLSPPPSHLYIRSCCNQSIFLLLQRRVDANHPDGAIKQTTLLVSVCITCVEFGALNFVALHSRWLIARILLFRWCACIQAMLSIILDVAPEILEVSLPPSSNSSKQNSHPFYVAVTTWIPAPNDVAAYGRRSVRPSTLNSSKHIVTPQLFW